MKKFSGLTFICLFVICLNCKTKVGYFSTMPEAFDTTQLSQMSDLFARIKIKKKNGGDVIELNCQGSEAIQFGGELTYKYDTIYHRLNDAETSSLFLPLNADVDDKWWIQYKPGISDSIVYLGKRYDAHFQDSLQLFMLQPMERRWQIHQSFVQFIMLGDDGIKALTFSSSLSAVSIYIEKRPTVFFEQKY